LVGELINTRWGTFTIQEVLIFWLFIVPVVALVIYGFISFLLSPSRLQRVKQLVSKVNKEHNLNFTFSETTLMGGSLHDPVVFFDTDNRKLLFVDGYIHNVHDYDFIRDWEVTWNEQTISNGLSSRINYSKIRIKLMTNDLKRPIFDVPMSSKPYAETWNQRLSILLSPT
jgi:hypothetical protein